MVFSVVEPFSCRVYCGDFGLYGNPKTASSRNFSVVHIDNCRDANRLDKVKSDGHGLVVTV